MYLKKFVTDEMLQKILEQTNLYNVWKEGKSVNTTSTETGQVRLSLKLFEEKFQAIQSFRVSKTWVLCYLFEKKKEKEKKSRGRVC